jgi:hypothetical protein
VKLWIDIARPVTRQAFLSALAALRAENPPHDAMGLLSAELGPDEMRDLARDLGEWAMVPCTAPLPGCHPREVGRLHGCRLLESPVPCAYVHGGEPLP